MRHKTGILPRDLKQYPPSPLPSGETIRELAWTILVPLFLAVCVLGIGILSAASNPEQSNPMPRKGGGTNVTAHPDAAWRQSHP